MNNPYQYLEEYVGQEITYKEFCEKVEIEPKTRIEKTRQLKTFEPYMNLDVKRDRLLISRLYDKDEMLLVKRNSNFQDYFENLLILHLNDCPDNVAKFTYSDVEKLFCLVNENYVKTKYNKKEYITSKDLKKNYNRFDFEDYEIAYDINKNINLFFDVSDRIMRKIIDNALDSMEKRSLILVNKSFRLYREIYVPEINEFRLSKTDCTDEQKNEILDIKKRLMDKFGLKNERDIFFMKREPRLKYYEEFNAEIKSSKLLDRNDRSGKLFVVNLGKEGLQIEADKIESTTNKKMLNTNFQYKLLKTNELLCINEWIKSKLVEDNINVTNF